MKTILITALTLLIIVTLNAGCGRRKQQAPSTAPDVATSTQPSTANEDALAATDDAFLGKLEQPEPAAEPVTRENYEQKLNELEAELVAEAN